MKKIFFIFFFIVYIFNINFKYLMLDTYKICFLLSVPVFSILFFYSKKFRVFLYHKRTLIYLFILISFSGLIVLFFAVLNGATNFTVPIYFIQYGLSFALTSMIVVFYLKIKNMDVIKVILIVGIIQAVMIFLMMLFPLFKELYLHLLIKNEGILSYYGYREVGLTGFANYTVGTTQATIYTILLSHCIEKNRMNLKVIILMLILISSAVICSRSSLLIIIPYTLVTLLFNVKNNVVIKKIIPLIVFILLFLVLIISYIYSYIGVDNLSPLLQWMIEPISYYIQNGKFGTASSNTLADWYYIPDYNTFLWGDWKYVNPDGSYYMHNDAGYMRFIFYMGIILSIFLYMSFVVFWILATYFSKLNKNLVILSLFFLIFIFILQYKGVAFVDASGTLKLIFILWFYNIKDSDDNGYLYCR